MRTREGRPVCDICDRVGNVRQDCYARVDQLNQYQNSQNVHPRPQSGPGIAALEFAGTTEQVVAQFNLEKPQRVNPPFTANPEADQIKRGYESGPTRKVDKSTMTIPPSNQLNHQRGEQEAQPEKVYYATRSNRPTFDSTEVPRINTIEAVEPINYNSMEKKEAHNILKNEFTEPAADSTSEPA